MQFCHTLSFGVLSDKKNSAFLIFVVLLICSEKKCIECMYKNKLCVETAKILPQPMSMSNAPAQRFLSLRELLVYKISQLDQKDR